MSTYRFASTGDQCNSLTLDSHSLTISYISNATRSVVNRFNIEHTGWKKQKYVKPSRSTIWPPCPYMVKTFKNLSIQNQLTDGLKLGM